VAEVFFTVHAQKTMAERKVTPQEVIEVVTHPETQYRGNANRPENKIYQRGTLAVVVRPQKDGSILVITVLWRVTDQWTSEEMGDKRS
jgi:hypothetical protein